MKVLGSSIVHSDTRLSLGSSVDSVGVLVPRFAYLIVSDNYSIDELSSYHFVNFDELPSLLNVINILTLMVST